MFVNTIGIHVSVVISSLDFMYCILIRAHCHIFFVFFAFLAYNPFVDFVSLCVIFFLHFCSGCFSVVVMACVFLFGCFFVVLFFIKLKLFHIFLSHPTIPHSLPSRLASPL